MNNIGTDLNGQLDTTVATRVEALLSQMTLAEKIGQMTQVEKNSITPDEVARYGIGSVLSGGGGNPTPNTPAAWAAMVRSFLEAAQTARLGIPLIYGVDAVHGHNNLRGATIFPHNVGLGATRNAQLVTQIGRLTALELLATNVHWNFAPTVAVPQDIRWGRTYEGFGEDTELVSELGVAYLRGLQGERLDAPHSVLASVKHFLADGGTSWGSTRTYDWIDQLWRSDDARWRIDQGDARIDEATLRAVHLPPYVAAMAAGARNIMVSYSSWNGQKMHAHRYLLTDVLKGELGFTGFLVSDWQALIQLSADSYAAVVTAINAGLDMIMVPFDYLRFIHDLTLAVTNGDVSLARINDAVRRILTVKLELGLDERPFGDETLLSLVGSDAHRQVAREAVRRSLVLLKNEGQTLPLARETPVILVAGWAADNIGWQCGGWTIEWMGGDGPITPGTTLLEGVRQSVSAETTVHYQPTGVFDDLENIADVGLVVLSEPPYAEGEGDRDDLSLSPEDNALLERVRPRCRRLVAVLYSGRPLLITEQLPLCDAFVAAWLPGTEGNGVSDMLFGAAPFTARLPYTWPRTMAQVGEGRHTDEHPPLFPFGYGLS